MEQHDTFETARLEMFRTLGIALKPVRLTDAVGREIYAMEAGSGDPTIFIHGGLAQAGEWAGLIPRVAEGRRVILVDRPGCGLSYTLDYTGVDYEAAAAEFVGAVLDGLGLDSAHFVGNSMGGYFCLAFALASPERVTSLTLIGAPAGLTKFVPYPVRIMATRWLGKLMLSGEMTIEQVRKQIYQTMLVADASRCDDMLLEVGALANKVPGVANSAATMLNNVVGWMGWRRLIRDRVAALDVRTRFVWGDKDAFEPAESGAKLAARMPRADFVRVEDAGHIPWHDQPDACAAAIMEFWASERRMAA